MNFPFLSKAEEEEEKRKEKKLYKYLKDSICKFNR